MAAPPTTTVAPPGGLAQIVALLPGLAVCFGLAWLAIKIRDATGLPR